MDNNEMVVKLENRDGDVWASSQDVAEKFGKAHKTVLRSIYSLESELNTAQFCALFKDSDYIASNGKKNKMFLMTRDGFSLLAMGFTGKEAIRWKVK